MLETISQSEEVQLTGDQVRRVLEDVARSHAEVRVTSDQTDDSWTGRFVTVAEHQVEIAFDDNQDVTARWAPDARCDAAFQTTEGHYRFVAGVRGVARGTGRAALERPTCLWVRQRRRFWRAEVRTSTPVRITNAVGGEEFSGALLNLSPEGMACRVADREAPRLRDAARLNLVFELDDGHGPIHVAAELRAQTPAGSVGHTVLRLEFVPDSIAGSERRRLQRATGVGPGKT